MSEYPSLPLWIDAYTSDTHHLSFAEHGAYLGILMLMWKTPECRVPNDPAWLQRKLRATDDEWQNLILPIISEFCKTDGNWITQPRLSRERKFLDKQRKQRRAAAKSRHNKNKIPCEKPTAPQPSRTAPTPTPTPTPIEEDVPSEHPAGTPFGHELRASTWDSGKLVVGPGLIGKAVKAGMDDAAVLRAVAASADKDNPRAFFAACVRDFEPVTKLSFVEREALAERTALLQGIRDEAEFWNE